MILLGFLLDYTGQDSRVSVSESNPVFQQQPPHTLIAGNKTPYSNNKVGGESTATFHLKTLALSTAVIYQIKCNTAFL